MNYKRQVPLSILLIFACNLKAMQYSTFTPLHMATSPEEITTLISRGWNVNAPDASGQTPLFWHLSSDGRSDHNKLACIDTLLRAGAQVNIQDKTGRTIIMQVVQLGTIEMIARVLQADPDLEVRAGPLGITVFDLTPGIVDPQTLKQMLEKKREEIRTKRAAACAKENKASLQATAAHLAPSAAQPMPSKQKNNILSTPPTLIKIIWLLALAVATTGTLK